jgi:hypothetical protein
MEPRKPLMPRREVLERIVIRTLAQLQKGRSIHSVRYACKVEVGGY